MEGWTSIFFKTEFESIHIQCRMSLNAHTAAILFSIDKSEFSFEYDSRRECWSFCEVYKSWLPDHQAIESVSGKITFGQSPRIDIFIRDGFFEAYVDKDWKMTRVLNCGNEKIKLGFATEEGQARFENISVWELETS